MRELQQAWPRPAHPRPIVVLGAGAIVRTAHLPAYRRLGLPICGLFDVDPDRARATAGQFGVPQVHASLDDAASVSDAVFDVAVPGDQIVGILERLPDGAPVLIQKPMGADLREADRILACCHEKHLIAAVNFQLRFAPGMLALHDLVCHRDLGRVVDIDVRVVIEQPWRNWTFMLGAPRIEIVYHSIHYIDAIRWLVGEPAAVYCKTVRHPSMPQLADTRSSVVLDYGNLLRCSLVLNHTHMGDATEKMSQIMVEGTNGIARVTCTTCRPAPRVKDLGGRRCRCADPGSRKRSKDRCPTSSASSQARTRRSSHPLTMRSKRWPSSKRAISRAPRAGPQCRRWGRASERSDNRLSSALLALRCCRI
jgi:predicted dehydrogenase